MERAERKRPANRPVVKEEKREKQNRARAPEVGELLLVRLCGQHHHLYFLIEYNYQFASINTS